MKNCIKKKALGMKADFTDPDPGLMAKQELGRVVKTNIIIKYKR